MELKTYISARTDQQRTWDARSMAYGLRISLHHLLQIAKYKRCPSIKLAIEIEEYTKGVVNAWDLLKRCTKEK